MSEPTRSASFGIQRQMEIYEQGLLGVSPGIPLAFEELEAQAKAKLKATAFAYVAGAAGAERTVRANQAAFDDWRIVPRFLRNVLQRDLSVEVLGRQLTSPILLAPVGVLGIVHADAELAVAKAAKQLGIPFIASTVSSFSMEAIDEAAGEAQRWFQLYWPADRDLAASFIQRAETAGYSALVVTLDTYLLSWRERDLQNAYLPFLTGDGLANYFTDPVFQKLVGENPRTAPVKAVKTFAKVFSNPGLTWDDLAWLRGQCKAPILLKGIMHPDDARRALDFGMDGIIVSNHGGRQLDGAKAALHALPEVAGAVGAQTTVLFDSGIRRGADVFKALALGAQAVLLGRPYVYGLALQGEAGIREVVANLLADFDLTLGLAGCTDARGLTPNLLERTR